MKYFRSCSVIGTFCKASIFNGHIKLYESLLFVGNLPVQFSYENETHPLGGHMLHGIGLRPISAQDGDFAHCDERPETLSLDSANPLEKGLDPKPLSLRRGDSA